MRRSSHMATGSLTNAQLEQRSPNLGPRLDTLPPGLRPARQTLSDDAAKLAIGVPTSYGCLADA